MAVRELTDGEKAELNAQPGVLSRLAIGSNLQEMQRAINLMAISVGKLEWFADHFDPSENAPWLILSNPDAVLDAAHWPDLVPYYRDKKLRYMPGTGSAKTAFDITTYSRSSNTVTITLANTDPEKAIMAALAEENLVHGSFSGWISINLPSALNSGDVPAGDYAITALNAGARTISFGHIGSNIGATAVTATMSIYPHRIPGSSTTARHYQIAGRTLVSINDAAGEVIAGARRRDRFQGHYHQEYTGNTSRGFSNIEVSAPSGNWSAPTGNSTAIIAAAAYIKEPKTDGVNGTPRFGATTDPRSLGAVLAIYGGRYVA